MEIYEYTTQMQLKKTYPDEQVFQHKNSDNCKNEIIRHWINFEHKEQKYQLMIKSSNVVIQNFQTVIA